MKALTLIFVVLIALLQYPLWLGKGSWLRVWNLNTQIAAQQEKNDALKMRNEALNAEVRDLKSGRAAIEERARSEFRRRQRHKTAHHKRLLKFTRSYRRVIKITQLKG